MITSLSPSITQRLNPELLKGHLPHWLKADSTASLEAIAMMTGKHKRHIKRDAKLLLQRLGKPEEDPSALSGHDALLLLAGYHPCVSLTVAQQLIDYVTNTNHLS